MEDALPVGDLGGLPTPLQGSCWESSALTASGESHSHRVDAEGLASVLKATTPAPGEQVICSPVAQH